MKRILAATLLLAACTDHGNTVSVGAFQEVLVMPAIPSSDLDLLFMIGDSPDILDKQLSLKASFPTLMDQLALLPGGLPNLHIGVITSDMGSSGLDGVVAPAVGGTAQGACNGTGKGGALRNPEPTMVTGMFISDVAGTAGRERNYTGELSDAFSMIASGGAAGCAFVQPLSAVHAAVDPSNTANAGFVRPDANLAVVLLADKDDCSLVHATMLTTDTTTLGPLKTFRCTRFGVTCDVGGGTSDAMYQVGAKSSCHPNTASPYLADVHAFAEDLKAVKADASQVMVAVIAGEPSPVDVELVPPLDGTTPIPTLDHSCTYTGRGDETEPADPAVRLASFASEFGSRGAFESVCSQDLSPPLTQIGISTRQMMGDGCLAVKLADTRSDVVGIQPMCEVTDGDAALPSCDSAVAGQDCWLVVADSNRCPGSPDSLRIEIQRSEPQVTQRYTHVKCLTAQ